MPGEAPSPDELRRWAWIGLLGHAPALRLFAGVSISAFALRLNLVMVGLTLLGVAAAWTWGGAWRVHMAVAVFLSGHLSWSITLAALVMRGHAASSRTAATAAAARR